MKKPQLLALVGALVVIVLLLMAPRTPVGKQAAKVHPMDPGQAKTQEAIALVNGPDPMRGILMLREVLEEDPDNVEAHWHLGLFSIQSGQYDKALARFQKVLELDSVNFPDAWFYLGRTYATLDSNAQAIASFKKYRTLTQDTAILNGVDRFLIELENVK
ncbi:MAG: tetratricopeptide repeat protein [Flavobacteriales bacterium]|nr:tetratricopeptide repeat protein [Flavobacteriales bacterium]